MLAFEVTKAVGQPETAHMMFNVSHAVNGNLNFIYQDGNGNIGVANHSGIGDNVAGG